MDVQKVRISVSVDGVEQDYLYVSAAKPLFDQPQHGYYASYWETPSLDVSQVLDVNLEGKALWAHKELQCFFDEMKQVLLYGYKPSSGDALKPPTDSPGFFQSSALDKIWITINAADYGQENRNQRRAKTFARRTKDLGWDTPRIQGRSKCGRPYQTRSKQRRCYQQRKVIV